MRNHNRIFTLLLLAVFISCNGQNKTQQEKVCDIAISLTGKSTLDFSLVDGHFDNVYGNVNGGFQDKAGNIWFGTTGAGAIRYDGKFFTHFTTKDKFGNNSVIPLLEDKQGNIWFSTADGICRYDGKTFTSIPIIRTDQNNLPLFTLSNSSNRNTSPLSITCAMQDEKGSIWIGTELNGIYRYDGEAFTALLSKGIINTSGLRLNTIKHILEDKKGNIWFASWNNEGLCRYDGNSLVSYTPKNGLGDNMIYSLLEDAVGNIWIGTRNHGVWRYDGKSFSSISADTDFKDECIYSIAQDKSGHLWFSTQSKGVWRFDGKSFTNFTTKDGLSNNSVFSIVAEDKGITWFGTSGMGLCSYNGKAFKNFTVRSH